MTEPAITVDRLSIALGGAPVLSDVSFAVADGGFLSVVGPNGAGKSTLVRCLDGLVKSDGGRVLLSGTPIERLSRRRLARRMAYVPQAEGRDLPFVVRTFVEMGRYPHVGAWASLGAEDHEAVAAALGETDIWAIADRSMETLSGGERQRVLIAAALAQGGTTLLLDEPTTFLDYRHQVQIVELLERLHRDRGLTIVAVTHDLNWTVPVSDAVLALRGGRVVFHGPPAELVAADTLEAIYDTDFDLVTSDGRALPVVVPTRRSR